MATPEPFVSVIVPVRNEIRTIDRCLAALIDQDYPADRLEVLVVDGASEDGTPAAVRARAAATARPIRLLHNPARHAAQAMNLGIAAAHGEIIARVDGHAIIPKEFLSRCVEVLRRRPEVDCVSGALRTAGRTPTGRAVAAAMSSLVGVGPARFRTGARAVRRVDTVAFPVYRREVLARLGPLDEELVRNQDDELNLRLTRAGGTILLLPDVRIVYFCQSTLRGLWRQYFQYGFWKVRVMQKHGRPASWRHLVPGAFVAALAVLLPAAALVPAARLPAIVLLAAYAALITTASLWLAWRHGPALLPRIGAALVVLHLAYGAGFWTGVATFGAGRRDADASQAAGAAVAPSRILEHRSRARSEGDGCDAASL